MTEQITFSLIAAAVGFVSALFFCLGNIANSATQIRLQSTTFAGFNPDIVRALSHQRAQNTVGAVLLLTAFGLQVIAALAPTTLASWLPFRLQSWPCLIIAVLAPTCALSFVGYWLLAGWILRQVNRLHEEAMRKNAPTVNPVPSTEQTGGSGTNS